MALRMVDDDPNEQEDYNDNSGGGGGRNTGGGGMGGGLIAFLPLLFSLFKGGKGMIVLIVLAVGGYFLFKNMGGGAGSIVQNLFSQSGYNYSPEEFKKAKVYEGLEDDNTKNPLPEAVSLAAFAPQRGDQGKQGSCVAWSSAYAARTVLEAASTRTPPDQLAYSPAFLYNNIALEDCQGSYIQRAMEFMQTKGAVKMENFQYDENDCSRQASNSLLQEASANKIHGFHRLTESDDVNGINIRAIKEHLAKDAPVVIGMMVGGSFMQEMMGQKVWHPSGEDRQQMGFGGHAMCVIGYDDRVEGGAFQIMNSWGPQWGQNGLAYVRYGDFKEFVREAYGLDPLAKRGAALNVAFECTVGLINNENKQPIALKAGTGNVFHTVAPIKKGTKFKMEIKNALECYIYIFTPIEGKSTVLFPYKPIHSAYCGITGYRLFPRKESIQADDIGNKEIMAIVVSKNELDYKKLNDAINSSTQADFAAKVNEAVAANAIKNVSFSNSANGSIYFKTAADQNSVVATIVDIDKQ
jgi:hypothetical protein